MPNFTALSYRPNAGAGDTIRVEQLPEIRKRSDAEVMGLDLIDQPVTPFYQKIALPNYAGPSFRYNMSLVDASFNRPLVLTTDKPVPAPPCVLPPAESAGVRARWETAGRRWCSSAPKVPVGRSRCSSTTNVPVRLIQMEPEPDTSGSSCGDRTREAVTADPAAKSKRRRTIFGGGRSDPSVEWYAAAFEKFHLFCMISRRLRSANLKRPNYVFFAVGQDVGRILLLPTDALLPLFFDAPARIVVCLFVCLFVCCLFTRPFPVV